MARVFAREEILPDLTPFRDAVKPTYAKAKDKWGADVDAILSDAEAVRKALPVKK